MQKPVEDDQQQTAQFKSPMDKNVPISIETAMIYGEVDRFYHVIDPSKTPESINLSTRPDNEEIDVKEVYNLEKCPIVALHQISIEFDNEPCCMILFRNWTETFKYQLAKS